MLKTSEPQSLTIIDTTTKDNKQKEDASKKVSSANNFSNINPKTTNTFSAINMKGSRLGSNLLAPSDDFDDSSDDSLGLNQD